jgi:hypothetical protein
MNCADVRLRLPALLYGDLSADEARAVRAHLARCPSCQREQAGVAEVRRLLDAVPAPAVAVDLPRLYREAAARHERRLRRWRRVALASLAAAAAVLLTVLLSRLEIRLDSHQLVLRWGDVAAAPEVHPSPPSMPQPQERSLAAASAPLTADVEQQLRLLTDLVQALSNDADLRDDRRREEIARLRGQMQYLQQQITQLRLTTEKDLSALYAAQLPEKAKGTQR